MTTRRKGFTQLVLDSGTWQYKVGKSYVVIYSPDGERSCPNHSQVTGLTWNSIERYHWKCRGIDHEANIKPSTMKRWVNSRQALEK